MYDNTSFFFPVSLYQKFQFKKSCHFRRLKFLNKESEICFPYYTHIEIERAWPCINIQILLESICVPSSENPANVECVTIEQCTKELRGHLKLLKMILELTASRSCC